MILMDTHVWLRWIIGGDQALPDSLEQRIAHADRLVVSAISCWEIRLLEQRGRIALPLPAEQWIAEALMPTGVEALPVSCEIAQSSAVLAPHHRDPADRIIIATAIHHQAMLASLDGMFPHYREVGHLLLRDSG